jgi:hypothetical protein
LRLISARRVGVHERADVLARLEAQRRRAGAEQTRVDHRDVVVEPLAVPHALEH